MGQPRPAPPQAAAEVDDGACSRVRQLRPQQGLVDFDNAQRKPPGDWSRLGIERFNRSLRKVALETGTEFDSPAWAEVLAGYTAT